MKELFVCALLLVPFGVSHGQQADIRAGFRHIPDFVDISAKKLGSGFGRSAPSEAPISRFSARPILFGAVIGAGIGAAVGYAVGGARSCPTSPGYACDQPAFGTAGGAAIGLALGAAVGAIIGMRHSSDSHRELTPLVGAGGVGARIRYSRRF